MENITIPFDQRKFDEIKLKAENFYKKIGKLNCPYHRDQVVFNARGLEHLKFKRKYHARVVSEQYKYIRLKLLFLVPRVIESSHTIQGESRIRKFEPIEINSRTE